MHGANTLVTVEIRERRRDLFNDKEHDNSLIIPSLQRDIALCCCAFGKGVTDDSSIDIDEPKQIKEELKMRIMVKN